MCNSLPILHIAMHEVGIAASILDAVRAQVAKHPGKRATAVGVRIGALAGVDGESLQFGFDALVKDSDVEPLHLEIEQADLDELDLAWIEIEEAS
jgi:Zn finger protein HypA/HybF involved in hydrogenase expression